MSYKDQLNKSIANSYFFEKYILLACLMTWPLSRGEIEVDFILIAEPIPMWEASDIAHGCVSLAAVTESRNMAAIIQIITWQRHAV